MNDVSFIPAQENFSFPHPEEALEEPDGLLAIGGDLSCHTLLTAYKKGIFPWFNEDEPIMWWSPSVRAVIPTHQIHISKNMKKLINAKKYHVSADDNFDEVINCCSDREETWISPLIKQAYIQLHKQRVAHSIAVYDDDSLVGGLYGVFVNNIFCGESMFSLKPNTSKLALIKLALFLHQHGCRYVDCQLVTTHLKNMGAKVMDRKVLLQHLEKGQQNKVLDNTYWDKLWE